ncbi:hypothetical protein ACIQ6Y_13100 [Streptomyces sp. NPDC096205]|uniref:hypothetical protein n=1 Tax=Streptomyces sp. NPDC096205 TaxID=3366081 RepID=UPI00382C77A0
MRSTGQHPLTDERARPSVGEQVGVCVALLVLDLMVIAYLVILRYGMASWGDAFDSGNAPDAPEEAVRGMWILAGGAVVTGGGLLLLRWWVPGFLQLAVLGAGAALLGSYGAGP